MAPFWYSEYINPFDLQNLSFASTNKNIFVFLQKKKLTKKKGKRHTSRIRPLDSDTESDKTDIELKSQVFIQIIFSSGYTRYTCYSYLIYLHGVLL